MNASFKNALLEQAKHGTIPLIGTHKRVGTCARGRLLRSFVRVRLG